MMDSKAKIIGSFVLSGDENQRGAALEGLCQRLLLEARFADIRERTRKTGAEIDLLARNQLTGQTVQIECKATEEPIGPAPLRAAYSELKKAHGSDPARTLMVISLGGFTGTARAWADELGNDDRQRLRLVDSVEYLKLLVDAKVALGPEAAQKLAVESVNGAVEEVRYVVTSAQVLARVTVSSVAHGKVYVFFLPDGSIIGPSSTRPFADSEDGSVAVFDLGLGPRIQDMLLTGEWAALNSLAERLEARSIDVDFACKTLEQNGCCMRSLIPHPGGPLVALSQGTNVLLALAKDYAGRDDLSRLMESQFFLRQLDDFITARISAFLQLSIDEYHKALLRFALSRSVSAFEFCAFGIEKIAPLFSAPWRTGIKLNVRGAGLDAENIEGIFWSEILRRLSEDASSANSILKFNVRNGEVFGVKTQQRIMITNGSALVFDKDQMSLVIRSVGDGMPITPGVLSFATVEEHLRHMRQAGNILYQVQEFERALDFFDELSRLTSDPQQMLDLILSIGSCHEILGHFEVALGFYRQAIEKSKDSPFARRDAFLGEFRCTLRLDKADEAVQRLEIVAGDKGESPIVRFTASHQLLACLGSENPRLQAHHATMKELARDDERLLATLRQIEKKLGLAK